jgi:hypothetical protein
MQNLLKVTWKGLCGSCLFFRGPSLPSGPVKRAWKFGSVWSPTQLHIPFPAIHCIHNSYLCTFDLYSLTQLFWPLNETRLSARCHFTGPKKVSISRPQPPPTCLHNGCCLHQKHYSRGCIIHRCIGGFMYKILRGCQGPIPPLQCG